MAEMNPGEEARREAFADGLVKLATETGLATEEMADSLLTMLVGIFIANGIPSCALHERVDVAWRFGVSQLGARPPHRGEG